MVTRHPERPAHYYERRAWDLERDILDGTAFGWDPIRWTPTPQTDDSGDRLISAVTYLEYAGPDGKDAGFTLIVPARELVSGVDPTVSHYHLLPAGLQLLLKPRYDEAVRTGAYVPPVFPALPPPPN